MVFHLDDSYFVSSGDEEEDVVDDDVEDTTRDASSDEEDTEITEVDSEDEETEKEESSTDGMELDSDDDALPFLQKENSESGDAADDDVLAVSVENPKRDMVPAVLRAAFAEDPVCPKVSSLRMVQLCEQTKMPANVIHFWFENQLRKQNEESDVTATTTTVSNGLLMDGIVKGEEEEREVRDEAAEGKTNEKSPTDDPLLLETSTEKEQDKRNRRKRGRPKKLVAEKPDEAPEASSEGSSSNGGILMDTTVKDEEKKKGEQSAEKKSKKQKTPEQIEKPDQTSEATSEGGSSNGEMLDSTVQDEEKDEEEGAKKKSKKHKTPEQIKILMAAFEADSQVPAVKSERMLDIRERTGLQEKGVINWFSNRRKKLRRAQARKDKGKEPMATPRGDGPKASSKAGDELDAVMDPPVKKQKMGNDKRDQTSEATLEGDSSDDGMLDSTVKDEEERNNEEKGAKKKKWNKTPEQIKHLLAEFETDSRTPTFNSVRMRDLCARTGLDRKVVDNWFSTRRSTIRRAREREERENADKEAIKPMITPRGDGPKLSSKALVVDPPMKKQKMGNDSLSPSGSALNNNNKKQVSFHTSMRPPPPVPLPFPDSSNQNPVRNSASRSVRKCLICGDLCAMPPASIVSMNEASNLDGYYGSSLAQALNFTLRIDVCSVHREKYSRYKRSMANQQ